MKLENKLQRAEGGGREMNWKTRGAIIMLALFWPDKLEEALSNGFAAALKARAG